MTRAHSRLAQASVLVLVGGVGCDTLSARRTAQEGVHAYKNGQFEDALAHFEAALQRDRSLAAVQLNRGFTCLQLFKAGVKEERQRYAACAIDAFKSYQMAQPDDARGRDYLLQSFVDTLRYDDALAYFQPELARTPPSKDAMALLGQIAAQLGKVDTALEWCNKRAEAAPSDPSGHQCRGVLIWQHLHKHPEVIGADRLRWTDQGIEALSRAIALDPSAPEAYTYANLLHRERALGHCQTAPIYPGTEVPDAGTPDADAGPVGELDAATLKACDDARKADLEEAARLQKLALDKARTAQGLAPAAPSTRASTTAPGGG